MKIWRRIRNLWRLSEYRIDKSDFVDPAEKVLIKDFPTIKKKLAMIIREDANNIFSEEIKEA